MLILIIAIAVIVFSIITCFIAINKYFTVSKKYKKLRQKIDNKYIKNDVKLQNAVYLAQQWAKQHNDIYEERIFYNLLKELKGKQ